MLVDRYGPRLTVFFGILGLAIILTLYAAFVTSFAGLLISHVAMSVFASVSGVPVYSIFIAQWFEGGIGLAMGLVLAGYSAAGTIIPAILGPIASTMGWRFAMACICCLLWFVGLPVTYFALHENYEEHTQQRTAASGGIPEQPLASQFSWTFVGFALSYILLQYCFGCFGENIMFFLTLDRGIPLAIASFYFSALNLASFSAKLVGGHLGDRFDRFHVASAASGLAAIGIIFLFLNAHGVDDNYVPYLTHSHVAMVLFTVLFGFGYGATFNSLYALTPIVFGRKNLGRTQSALFGLGLGGNAVGSVLTGVLKERYGTYQTSFLVAAVACIANFFVFNVTRMTLGGSLEGMKALKVEQDTADVQPVPHTPLPPSEISALDGGNGEMQMDEVRPDSRLLAGCASGGVYDAIESGRGGMQRSESVYVDAESGMVPEKGYPIVRDWSSSSLRGCMRRTRTHEMMGSTPVSSGGGLKKSTTFEAMIESGILSASLEAVGYLGTHGRDHVSQEGGRSYPRTRR